MTNRFILRARLARKDSLRRTPAGVAVLALVVAHRSSQPEAGLTREVSLEMECIAIGSTAERLDQIQCDSALDLTGFIAQKSRKSRMPVMHITEFELK